MPLPTDFADLEPDDAQPHPQPQRSAKAVPPPPAPTIGHAVTRIELHQAHKQINKLGERQDEFEAKVDATIPGADYKTHYDHHARITEREVESKKLWSEVRKALLISFILLVSGAIGTGLWNYVKFGGLLK